MDIIPRRTRNGALLRIRYYPQGEKRGNTARLEPCGHGWTIMTWFSRDTSSYYCWEKEPMPGVSGIGGRGTDDNSCACGCAAACGGGSACGDVGAATARGGGGGIGLRAGAAAGRGRGAAILGRRLCSEALVSEAFISEALASEAFISEALASEALASEALAMSREICCWLALSCSMLALSCPISCPTLARSRAIDCSNCADSAAALGATPGAAVWAGGNGCGGAGFAASA